jgi:hypothetical protein
VHSSPWVVNLKPVHDGYEVSSKSAACRMID